MGLPEALCTLLLKAPSHGYHLWATLESELGDTWEIRRTSVYLALGRMQREGLIELSRDRGAHGDGRQVLRITDAGCQRAETWMTSSGPTAEMPVKLAVVRLVAPDRFRELTAMMLSDQAASLRQLRRVRASMDGGFRLHVLGLEISTVQARLRWLMRVQEKAEDIVSERPAPRRRSAAEEEQALA